MKIHEFYVKSYYFWERKIAKFVLIFSLPSSLLTMVRLSLNLQVKNPEIFRKMTRANREFTNRKSLDTQAFPEE